ncbi:MAG TPA: hypothetical protein VJR89_33710 [Polyangiales bacterium]|nr:hypothetical protein [Polyangiales bacterium]
MATKSLLRASLVLAVGLICSCAGEAGPAGKNGADGDDGKDGKNGEQGLVGPQGPKGDRGDDGAGYQPKFWAGCSVTLDLIGGAGLGTDGIGETALEYTLLRYSNNDLEVTCEAGLGSAEESADGIYFPAATKGSLTGGCIVSP